MTPCSPLKVNPRSGGTCPFICKIEEQAKQEARIKQGQAERLVVPMETLCVLCEVGAKCLTYFRALRKEARL
jgi:hypothetical protein